MWVGSLKTELVLGSGSDTGEQMSETVILGDCFLGGRMSYIRLYTTTALRGRCFRCFRFVCIYAFAAVFCVLPFSSANKDLYIILSSNNFIDHTYRTLKVCLFMKFTTYTFSLSKSFTMMRVTLYIDC